ncbi:MAG: DUF2442 domain-containing protein [Opitutaceae bacterium]
MKSISFSGSIMKLCADNKEYRVDLALVSDRLLKGTKVERITYRVSPSGYGIHWPLLDEDLTVDGLICAAIPAVRAEKKMA